jgi:spermidine synthase
VLFDVFIDDLTPVVFMQTEFLESLKKTVAPGGLLLFSKIHDSHHSKIENEQFEKRFTKVFPSAFSIDTDGNKLFCWENKQ